MREYEAMIGALARWYACWYAPVEDLLQEGRLAALGAVERYDGSFGCAPATWAWHCIRGRMLRYVRDQSRLRTHGPHGCEESLDALEAAGVSYGSQRIRIRYGPAAAVPYGCGELRAEAMIPDISTACIERLFVEELLAGLIPRHRTALLLLYAEQWTGAETGAALGVRNGVQALVTRALQAARRRL